MSAYHLLPKLILLSFLEATFLLSLSSSSPYSWFLVACGVILYWEQMQQHQATRSSWSWADVQYKKRERNSVVSFREQSEAVYVTGSSKIETKRVFGYCIRGWTTTVNAHGVCLIFPILISTKWKSHVPKSKYTEQKRILYYVQIHTKRGAHSLDFKPFETKRGQSPKVSKIAKAS